MCFERCNVCLVVLANFVISMCGIVLISLSSSPLSERGWFLTWLIGRATFRQRELVRLMLWPDSTLSSTSSTRPFATSNSSDGLTLALLTVVPSSEAVEQDGKEDSLLFTLDRTISKLIFAAGFVLMLVAIVGLLSFCMGSYRLLLVYVLLLLAVGIVSSILIGLFYTNQEVVRRHFTVRMHQKVQSQYTWHRNHIPYRVEPGFVRLWDRVQSGYRCCGIFNHTEYSLLPRTEPAKDLAVGEREDEVQPPDEMVTMPMLAYMWSKEEVAVAANGSVLSQACCRHLYDLTCWTKPDAHNSWIAHGCADQIWRLIEKSHFDIRSLFILLEMGLIWLIILTLITLRHSSQCNVMC
ncbi:unnamed protein product [Protopolystoma xenopodis]|uniref:Tetraspanin n=1 Tax=Protopolystoma xenopodis TaxID=117903 RepID=A0A448XLU3_9PLAT|nr:unnamed protein product [Protopolystoma xenopodis]